MPLDVEEETLVPDWVAVVPDDTGPENFLAKADDAERVHVPSSAGHVAPFWQIVGALDWIRRRGRRIGQLGLSVGS